MATTRETVRTSRPSRLESAHQHVVGFTCERCGAGLTVDSTIYEDILANGCVVCGTAADATAFTPRKTL